MTEDQLKQIEALASQDIPALVAEVRRLKEQQTWQPIETAPKDGTKILVFGDNVVDGKYIRAAAFNKYEGMFMHNGVTVGHGYLTHWMPLPNPPEEGK